MSNDKFITQLSIFISNEPGSLAAMTRTLKECNVNIKAFNIAESSGFGVFRAIVDDPEGSYTKLKEKNLIVRKTDIVGVIVENTPGGLFSAAKVLGDANINIEYGYALEGGREPIMFFRVDNPEAAIKAFSDAKMKVVSMKDF
jgi:hypothetical protein